MMHKPWSKTKRIITASIWSLAILIVAFILGSTIYSLGRGLGLIKSQDLNAAVTQEVLNNPQLVDRFYHSLADVTCTNLTLGFSVVVKHPIKNDPNPSVSPCTHLSLINAQGKLSDIFITQHSESGKTITETTLKNLTSVTTDSFSHPLYPGTMIRGFQDESSAFFIILSPTTTTSWVITLNPADPVAELAVSEMVKSLTLIPR